MRHKSTVARRPSQPKCESEPILTFAAAAPGSTRRASRWLLRVGRQLAHRHELIAVLAQRGNQQRQHLHRGLEPSWARITEPGRTLLASPSACAGSLSCAVSFSATSTSAMTIPRLAATSSGCQSTWPPGGAGSAAWSGQALDQALVLVDLVGLLAGGSLGRRSGRKCGYRSRGPPDAPSSPTAGTFGACRPTKKNVAFTL